MKINDNFGCAYAVSEDRDDAPFFNIGVPLSGIDGVTEAAELFVRFGLDLSGFTGSAIRVRVRVTDTRQESQIYSVVVHVVHRCDFVAYPKAGR